MALSVELDPATDAAAEFEAMALLAATRGTKADVESETDDATFGLENCAG